MGEGGSAEYNHYVLAYIAAETDEVVKKHIGTFLFYYPLVIFIICAIMIWYYRLSQDIEGSHNGIKAFT